MANLLAYTKFIRAEKEYLTANGWVQEETSALVPRWWIIPERNDLWSGGKLPQKEAVGLQRDWDLEAAAAGELV